MSEFTSVRSMRILEPMERISEVLFGLIMVMTFTGALSAAESGKAEVRTMLLAALGCNLAWGIIDAGLYLMARLGDFGHRILVVRGLHRAGTPGEGQQIVADALPPLVASVMTSEQLEAIRQGLIALPPPPRRPWLSGTDWLGALGVLLLVFVSTFPIVIPFLIIHDVVTAVRTSHAVGIALLFLVGHAFGRHAGLNGWLVGVAMVAIGVTLVVVTIALGG